MKYLLSFILGFVTANSVQAQSNCPPFEEQKTTENWGYHSPAVHCRAECKTNNDCVVIKDLCGKMAIVNKNYSAEVKQAFQMIKECSSKVDIQDVATAVCENKYCKLKTESCEHEKAQRDDFVKKSFSDHCEKDVDCSYLSLAGQACRQEQPVSVKNDFEKNRLTFSYLNDRVVQSCKTQSGKACNNLLVNQCFIGKCLRVSQKVDFVNYVNAEGVVAKLNLKSRTKPLVVADVNQIMCSKNEDCQTIYGVCQQNILSVNRDSLEVLRKKVIDLEKNVACPSVKKPSMIKANCLQGYCVFDKE